MRKRFLTERKATLVSLPHEADVSPAQGGSTSAELVGPEGMVDVLSLVRQRVLPGRQILQVDISIEN